MRTHRLAAWTGGSAIAATLVIATVLLWTTPRRSVQASMIFDSLQTGLNNAFAVTLQNIGGNGVVVNGHAVATHHITNADGLLQLDLRITGEQSAEEFAGLDVELHAAFDDAAQWIYVRSHALPANMLTHPAGAIFHQMAANGMLLNLAGLSDLLDDEGDDTADEEAADDASHFTFGISSDGPAPGERSVSLGFSLGGHTGANGGDDTTIGATADVTTTGGDDLEELGRLIDAVVHREATPEQIGQMVDWLESAAQEVAIQDLGDGFFRMTASAFDIDALSAEDTAWLADVELIVNYHDIDGVASATLNHVGDHAGSLHVQLADIVVDPTHFDQNRFVEEGVTRIVDVAAIAQLLALFGD